MLEDGDGIDLVQCYNSRTDHWTELNSMLIARSGSAACVLNDRIFVIGKMMKQDHSNLSRKCLSRMICCQLGLLQDFS